MRSANKRACRFIELIISTKRDTLTNSNEMQRDNIGTIARAIAESARESRMETNKSDTSAGSAGHVRGKYFIFCAENPPASRYFSARDRKQLSRRELACSSKLHAGDTRVDRERQMFIYYCLSARHCPRRTLFLFNFVSHIFIYNKNLTSQHT